MIRLYKGKAQRVGNKKARQDIREAINTITNDEIADQDKAKRLKQSRSRADTELNSMQSEMTRVNNELDKLKTVSQNAEIAQIQQRANAKENTKLRNRQAAEKDLQLKKLNESIAAEKANMLQLKEQKKKQQEEEEKKQQEEEEKQILPLVSVACNRNTISTPQEQKQSPPIFSGSVPTLEALRSVRETVSILSTNASIRNLNTPSDIGHCLFLFSVFFFLYFIFRFFCCSQVYIRIVMGPSIFVWGRFFGPKLPLNKLRLLVTFFIHMSEHVFSFFSVGFSFMNFLFFLQNELQLVVFLNGHPQEIIEFADFVKRVARDQPISKHNRIQVIVVTTFTASNSLAAFFRHFSKCSPAHMIGGRQDEGANVLDHYCGVVESLCYIRDRDDIDFQPHPIPVQSRIGPYKPENMHQTMNLICTHFDDHTDGRVLINMPNSYFHNILTIPKDTLIFSRNVSDQNLIPFSLHLMFGARNRSMCIVCFVSFF